MDIIDRLKYFMEKEQIASSQFADTCRIPRPTVSQILNRRNKTISDELIGKIHDAFPELSVMWLMFGEGEMISNSNIKISEPKISTENSQNHTINSEQQTVSQPAQSNQQMPKSFAENFGDYFTSSQQAKNIFFDETASNQTDAEKSASISFTPQSRKRISNIVVFYDDNSFESFMPSQN